MLFPQPDVLVVAEPGPPCSTVVQSVRCISPGEVHGGSFVALIPEVAHRDDRDRPDEVPGLVELCEVPCPDVTSQSDTELGLDDLSVSEDASGSMICSDGGEGEEVAHSRPSDSDEIDSVQE